MNELALPQRSVAVRKRCDGLRVYELDALRLAASVRLVKKRKRSDTGSDVGSLFIDCFVLWEEI